MEKVKQSDLSEKDKRATLDFQRYLFAEGISTGRVVKYVEHLYKAACWISCSLQEAGKENIVDLMRSIERKDYTNWTKHDYKVIIKRFYQWLGNCEDGEYPEEVRWIKTTMKNNHRKLPEELLEKEDVEKLVNVANHPRDKAMVSVLYESGCRAGELLSLKIKHTTFDEYEARITVNGKTGMKRIRLVWSVPYLSTWYECHPRNGDHEAYL